MTPHVLTVNKDMKVEDVLSFIRTRAEKDEIELYYLYVTDVQKHLLGVVSLRALLTKPYKTKIEEIMTRDIVKLHIDDPQDAVADVFMKYQYAALPVVDLYNRLKGMITWDDAQDIIEEETTEEIYQTSGISTDLVDEDEIIFGSTIDAVRARGELVGFIGGPPCPDFSIAGKNRGREGDNGKLSLSYINLIIYIKFNI